MMKRKFLGNNLTIKGMPSLISIPELYSNIRRQVNQNESQTDYDVIVVGAGSMGSSACYHLAAQGQKVLGLDQFDLPHEFGSHSGQSRIIRKAYFESPSYVPLLESAYHNWKMLEEACGSQVYFKTGLVYFAPEEHPLITGTQKSASKYNIEVKEFSREEQRKELPQFNIPDHYVNLIEVDAGFVTPERAILIFLEQALKHGASIHTKEKALDWSKKDGTITVKTNNGSYRCKKLVIATGAWASSFASLEPLETTRQIIAWARPKNRDDFALGKFPCWIFANPALSGTFYGFPVLPTTPFGEPVGLKFAHHTKGVISDPGRVDRTVSKEEEDMLVSVVRKFIPEGVDAIHTLKTCLYTYSPDQNFIVDVHPEDDDVVIAAGFSGHGFKFASVIGEILSNLAITGKTKHPIEFLNAKRF